MQLSITTYIAKDSAVHRLDARVKITLLAVYSAALFFVDTWLGMALAACAFAFSLALSKLPPRRVLGLAVPVYVLAGFTVLFNMFVFATPNMLADAGTKVASGAAFEGIYPLVGSFSLTVAGLMRGCFFAARILLLVFASLIVCFSSTSTELIDALNSFLSPLAKLGVPVDDVAMVFSIALRFIPVTAEEFCRVRDAQWSRGSKFGEGSVWQRLSAWQTVLIPLFVGLFRRADTLAQAMDARCYGMGARTSLSARRLSGLDVAVLVVGCMACVAVAAAL